jgi:hypothetical protein
MVAEEKMDSLRSRLTSVFRMDIQAPVFLLRWAEAGGPEGVAAREDSVRLVDEAGKVEQEPTVRAIKAARERAAPVGPEDLEAAVETAPMAVTEAMAEMGRTFG